jgi:hypothetical protein
VPMARQTTPDRCGSLADPPSEVQVTVVPGPAARAIRDRTAGLRAVKGRRLTVGLAVAVAAIGAIVVGSLHGGRTGARVRTRSAERGTAGPAGVAAAYRYPLGCLSVTMSASDRAYASTHVDRASPCWRYGVYVTVIFHRVGAVWRLALEAASSSCPVVSLPAFVRAQLAVCRRLVRPPAYGPGG